MGATIFSNPFAAFSDKREVTILPIRNTIATGNLIMITMSPKINLMVCALATFTASTALAQQPVLTSVVDQATVRSAGDAVPAPTAMEPSETYFDSGTACDSCGGGGACGCDCGPLGRGFIKRSDHAFDEFISPMTNLVFFEDPRMLTEARAIFFNHKVPLAAGGGNVQLYAMHLRARLSENVSFIATKDGYITSDNPLIVDGWADLSAGLKFNLRRDVHRKRLLSGGFMFELPTGEANPLQGNGDGEVNLFLTGAAKIGCRGHFVSAGGIRLPLNSTDESQSTYWSNHFDVQLRRGFYLFTEANWYHWIRSGQDGPIPGIEGLDVINLGSPGVAGNDIVTSAVGAKLKPSGNSEIGVAFEFPLTERRDIIDNRLTVDWIFRY